jgi:hypothetical protein
MALLGRQSAQFTPPLIDHTLRFQLLEAFARTLAQL